jgi:hypothetical protein
MKRRRRLIPLLVSHACMTSAPRSAWFGKGNLAR